MGKEAPVTMVLVALAGGLGALLRYELGGFVQSIARSTRPWGTLVVNLSGALALGLLAGAGLGARLPLPAVRVLGTGFLGGFTTFSTWMVESVYLFEEGRGAGLLEGAVNLAVMLGGGLGAAALGLWLAH